MADSKPLVRVATAGSVDDGKSTFLGRLLYDCGAVYEDHMDAIEAASRRYGEEGVNLALLTDGLRAEREQKITIDVAYRSFATEKRRFLLADTPGHEQYTRNMFTGASTADIAVLLVDIHRGITAQTKRHAFVTSLLRVPHVVFAVNKMDLVEYSETAFEEQVGVLREFVSRLAFQDLRFVPISALKGDGVAKNGGNMPWYSGPSVLEYLDTVELSARRTPVDFRFSVQCVVRPDASLRALAGEVGSGLVRTGEEVVVQPSGLRSSVKQILGLDGPQDVAGVGEPVMLQLADDIDVGRGDVLSRPKNPATTATGLEATVCWMGGIPAKTGAGYRLRIGARDVACRLAQASYRIDPETLHREQGAELGMNAIGKVRLETTEPVPVDLYEHNRAMGAFMLVEPETNEVAAAGLVTRVVPADEVWQGFRGRVVWLTGLSGAGKSTISDTTRDRLTRMGVPVVQLDGDMLRSGLNKDLGFSADDRTENIRRTSEVAAVLANQGFTVLCSFISPLQEQRDMARGIVGGDRFLETYVSCSLEVAEGRDVKGLYARARAGEIPEFTGVSAPYEVPGNPWLVLNSSELDVESCVEELIRALSEA